MILLLFVHLAPTMFDDTIDVCVRAFCTWRCLLRACVWVAGWELR